MNPIENVERFLSTGEKFRLGHLVTEQSHELTRGLSEWAQTDLDKAITQLKQVDILALNKMSHFIDDILGLKEAIQSTISQNGRIFLCGCGATGRLSLTLEHIWRELHPKSELVQAFMAGGDVALVHAIEGFEDYPEYGAKQLMQLGFSKKDLLIAITEGGETPFVIGAAEQAADISERAPFFIYCNSRDTLVNSVKRSAEVINNEKIKDLSWEVGPMALAGSTRMQASTVLQWGVGLALFGEASEIQNMHNQLVDFYKNLDLSWLKKFIEKESEIYKANEWVHYFVDEYAITTFTDTTERAPTFSLQAFSPLEKGNTQSLCYISMLGQDSAMASWEKLLQRPPHCLGWDINDELSLDYLLKFDFSEGVLSTRQKLAANKIHKFTIHSEEDVVKFELENLEPWEVPLGGDSHKLFKHTLVKMLLNIHSTLVMGRLDRYKSNLMTWVKPSNGKLIDRASRYVQYLLKFDGKDVNYEEVVRALFIERDKMSATDSIVLNTYRAISTA